MAYDSAISRFSDRPDPEGRDHFQVFYHNPDQSILDNQINQRFIDEEGQVLERAMEAADDMDGFRIALESSNRAGDLLSQSAYNILRKQMKSICKKNKVAYDELPAMESFGHMSKRELSMAMENVVTETLKGIWEKIRDAFISMHNKIKDWYIKAWDGAARLKKQAEGIKARADGMGTATPKNTSFEMAALKSLNIGYKVPSPADLIKGCQEIASISTTLLAKTPESYNKIFPGLEQSVKETVEAAKTMQGSTNEKDENGVNKANIGNSFGGSTAGENLGQSSGSVENIGNGKTNKVIEQLYKEFKETAKLVKIPDNGKGLEGDERYNKNAMIVARRNPAILPGNCMLVGTFPATLEVSNGITNEMYAGLRDAFKIGVAQIEAKPREIDDKGTFNTLTPAEISTICDSTIQTCDVFTSYRLLYDARDKATGSLMKQMDSLVASQGNLTGPGQSHIRNTVNTTVKIVKNINDSETQWSKYSMQVLNKAIVYCRQSFSQY